MPGLGVRSPSSPGVGIGVGGSPAAEEDAVNPNLLLWSEEFQQATWVKTSASVTPDAGLDPLGLSSADEIADATGTATTAQVSSVVASSGAVNTTVVPTSSWGRFFATATFDVGSYTFSIWLKDPADNGSDVQVRMDVSGGFIRCYLRDGGDALTFLAWGAKLETGAAATGSVSTYGKREGT